MFVAGLPVCHCGFGLLWLMVGEECGAWGLVAVLLGCPVSVSLWECCCGGRGAVMVVFGGCVVMCGEWVCWGGRG